MSDKINREAWLENAISGFVIPLIKQRTGLSPLKPIKVSVGFPPSGGRNRSNTGQPGTVGICMTSQRHKHTHIFIHPAYDSSAVLADKGVMEILIHEVLHACLPEKVGHRKDFSQNAKKVGLEGKPTATLMGEELRKLAKPWVESVGEYPHGEAIWSGGKLQRVDPNVKCTCTLCGYIARTTRKWLDAAGPPICPQDGIHMVEGNIDADEIDSPLGNPIHQTIEYPIKATAETKLDYRSAGLRSPTWDERWYIRMNRYVGTRGMNTDWWIVDYGERTQPYDGPPITDPVTGKPVTRVAVLDVVEPRLTHCESREDAISVLEALRDGSMTYDQVNEYKSIDDDTDIDWGVLEDPEDPDEQARLEEESERDRWEDDEETVDSPEGDSDPRFPWEIKKGIPIEAIDPQAEQAKREAWVGQERQAPPEQGEVDFEALLAQRTEQLEKLTKKGRR